MPQADLLLVVQPSLVMRLKTNVGNPLHKAKLDSGLIVFVWLSIRAHEGCG
jgi:hypothetical protein